MRSRSMVRTLFPQATKRYRASSATASSVGKGCLVLSSRQSCGRHSTPSKVSPPQHDSQPASERADGDERNDPRVGDEPQYESDVATVPSTAGAVAEEGILFGVQRLRQDIESVETCGIVSTDHSRKGQRCTCTYLPRACSHQTYKPYPRGPQDTSSSTHRC